MQERWNWDEDSKLIQQNLRPMRMKAYCGKCSSVVKQTKKDKQRREMPWCQECDVYFFPYWEFRERDGSFYVNFVPKTAHGRITDLNVISAIPQKRKKKNDRPVERHQRGATYNDPIPNPPQNSQENSNKAPEHKDVSGQILKILTENNRHFKTGELVQMIQASRQSVMVTLKKLIAKKQIKKIKHGVYRINKR